MLRALTTLILSGILFVPLLAFAQTAYEVTPEDEAVLQNQEALTHVWRDKSRRDGALDVFGAIDILAPPSVIWNIMTDCTRGHEIVMGMRSCDVLETLPNKASDIRQQVFDMGPFLPNAKTRFQSDYVPYKTITIRRVGGDLKIQDAVWSIEPQDNGLTRVSYRATILLKFPVPGAFIKNATRKDTPQIMRNLRRVAQADAQKQFRLVKGPLSSIDEMP